jgi:hypothetical protein
MYAVFTGQGFAILFFGRYDGLLLVSLLPQS